MSKAIIAEFDSRVSELREFYRRRFLIDVKEIKPKIDPIFHLIEADQSLEIKRKFLSLVVQLRSLEYREARSIIQLLGFCMRRLRWVEVEKGLKEVYPQIDNPETRLDVEALIKILYDPNWSEGEFEFNEENEKRWEL